jgi:signal transduction histidine kinase
MRHRLSRPLLQDIAAATIVLGIVATAGSAHAQDNKQVLTLYSTRRDAQFTNIAESELPRMLDVGLASDLDYYSEFIDLTRFPDPAYTIAFRDFLRVKYQDVKFDLVIAMQSQAIEFLDAQRNDLFRDTPAVFLSNDPAPRRVSNSTGLKQARDYAGTVRLLRRLQPDVTQVFVVSGAAAADAAMEQELRRQVEEAGLPLTFTYLSGLSTPDLERRLSRLPTHSAVYYLIVSVDGAGNKFHPLDYIDRVTASANAPVYSWVDSTFGRGIVGGSLYAQQAVVERVAQLALRVLGGERADDIPLALLNLNANYVDWRQLRRWGIDAARAPVGTIVGFRNPTIWDEYKGYILAAVVLLIVQTALITGLLIQRSRRRYAEGQLRGSERELLKSYERNRDLSTRLLQAQEAERARIARELHDDICQRMLLLTIELESLGRATDGAAPSGEALVMSRDIAKSLHELSHRLHPTRLMLIGLVPALEQLRLEVSRAGIAIAFTHSGVPATLPPDVMLCLFRVVQEALQNAIKYSNARDVAVDLRGEPTRLVLRVTDQGRGFDVDTAWTKGLGLASMAERLDAISGSLDILSRPGDGTQVMATVPLSSSEPDDKSGRTTREVQIAASTALQ